MDMLQKHLEHPSIDCNILHKAHFTFAKFPNFNQLNDLKLANWVQGLCTKAQLELLFILYGGICNSIWRQNFGLTQGNWIEVFLHPYVKTWAQEHRVVVKWGLQLC